MILNSAPKDKVETNSGGISEFKIRNSAKAFAILSSGLYANKIQAIIRELSCNAYDSHIAAGTPDKAFDVHLPHALVPEFRIRDYGVGLTHDEVVTIYTTYFESTKSDSNEYIGALGLGSKSPFSYTNNFSITAIKNGLKNIYSAFINDEGVPSVAQLVTAVPTDEPSGVEIKFAVENRNDMASFSYEASRIYPWFKVKPNMTGQNIRFSMIFDEKTDALRQVIDGVWEFTGRVPVDMPSAAGRQQDQYGRKIMRESHPHDNYARMGNVVYPISADFASTYLGDAAWTNKNRDTLKYALISGMIIDFGIGDLEIQPSREGLSFDKRTVANIVAKYDAIMAALEASFNTRITDLLTKHNNDKDQLSFAIEVIGIRNSVFAKFISKWIKANPSKYLKPGYYGNGAEFQQPKYDKKEIVKDYNINTRILEISYSYSEWNMYNAGHTGYIQPQFHEIERIIHGDNPDRLDHKFIFINDSILAKRESPDKVKRWFAENNIDLENLAKGNPRKDVRRTLIFVYPEDITKEMKIKEFAAKVYEKTIVDADILDSKDIKPLPQKKKIPDDNRYYNLTYDRDENEAKLRIDFVDFKQLKASKHPIYYIPVKTFTAMRDGKEWDYRQTHRTMSSLAVIFEDVMSQTPGFRQSIVLLVPERKRAFIQEHGMISYEDFVKETLKKYSAQLDGIRLHNMFDRESMMCYTLMMMAERPSKFKFSDKSPFGKAISTLLDATGKFVGKKEEMSRLASHFRGSYIKEFTEIVNAFFPETEAKTLYNKIPEYQQMKDALFVSYPLLTYFNRDAYGMGIRNAGIVDPDAKMYQDLHKYISDTDIMIERTTP